MALVIAGFCRLLVKPSGPVHLKVTGPVADVVAPRFNVVPKQIGLLLVTTGASGGLGSDSVNGPTALDGQPARDTKMLVYNPADKLGIIRLPLLFVCIITTVGIPDLVNDT